MRHPRFPRAAVRRRVAGAWRFSPHVIVVLVTFAGVFYAMQGAAMGFVWWWWGSSYEQVEFVMDEWRPNDGYPYVAGRVAGTDEAMHMPGAERDGARVLKEAPSIPFVAGSRTPVWWSASAPTFSYNDERANGVPVAAVPDRPGLARIALHLVLSFAILVAGLFAAGWVRKRAEQLTGIPSGR